MFKKLFFTYLIVILVSSVVIALSLDYVFRIYYKNMIADELATSAILIEKNLEELIIKKRITNIRNLTAELGKDIKKRITVINIDGTVLADSESDPQLMENHKDRPEIEKAIYGTIGQSIRYSNTLQIDMMYLAIPIKLREKVSGVIRVATPLDKISESLNKIHKVIAVSVLAGILVALILSIIIAKSFTNPIILMKSVAEKISKGDFSKRIELNRKDELMDLGRSLNTMSEELQIKINEIVKEKNELLAVLTSMSEGVIVVEKNKKVILVNPLLSKMLYLRSIEVIDKYYWEVIGNNDINQIIEDTLSSQQSLKKEITMFLPEERHIQIQTSAIFDSNRELFGVVGVFHDITQIKKLEKIRTEFVANASHELKTPLTTIGGFVETLEDGAIEDKKKAKEFLNIIKANTERMNNIINDLLIISKSESKDIKLDIKKVNLRKIIDNIITIYNERILNKKLNIVVDFLNGFPEINADEEKILQVFSNLIDNAIKFTDDNGKIFITGEYNDKQIKIKVSDTGIGIPCEHLSRIFERFYRVDKSRSREEGGTGLGLAIVKHLLQLHNGNVSVESIPGKGSAFIVELPTEEQVV